METERLLNMFGGEPVTIITTVQTPEMTADGPISTNYVVTGIFLDCDSKFIYLGPSIEDMTIAIARHHVITIERVSDEDFSAMIGETIDAPNRKDMN